MKTSTIYPEIICIDSFFRVGITDTEGSALHIFLPKFDDASKAESYCEEIANLLMRFAAEGFNRRSEYFPDSPLTSN